MSETTIKYNGVTLSQVRIQEYRIDNPSSAEHPSSGILMHSITGEALVFEHGIASGGSQPSSYKFQSDLMNKLNQPRRPLEIRTGPGNATDTSPAVGTYRLVAITSDGDPTKVGFGLDTTNGPFFRANITQITGTNALIVNFTAEFSVALEGLNFIKSFYCNASFSIDEIGLTTIRKTGSVQLLSCNKEPSYGGPSRRASNTTTGEFERNDVVVDFIPSSGVGDGFFADYYRRLVSGNLYKGFRRVRQEYATDESRTRMLFDITDQEFSRGLPAPARVGNCQYTFERNIEDSSAIGVKHFIASVKGDRNVTAGALLSLCVRLSQNRIDYFKDLITKIRVTEENMLSENSITYEVLAKATSLQVFNAGDGAEPGVTSAGYANPVDYSLLLRNILSGIDFVNGPQFKFEPAPQADAHGSALIVRVTPSAYDHLNLQDPGSSDLHKATTRTFLEENPVIYNFPNGVFDAFGDQAEDGINRYIHAEQAAVGTGPNRSDLSKAATPTDTPALQSSGGRKVTVHQGILIVPSVSFNGGTKVFQISTPVASVTDFLDGSRKNAPPQRMLGEKANNSVVTSLGFNVTSGTADRNGNRVLAAGYDRTTIEFAPKDLPGGGGLSTSNPSFRSELNDVDGVSVLLCGYFPTVMSLPHDNTQGDDFLNTQPTYTSGLGSPEVLA